MTLSYHVYTSFKPGRECALDPCRGKLAIDCRINVLPVQINYAIRLPCIPDSM